MTQIIADLKAWFPELASVLDVIIQALAGNWACYYGGGYDGCNKEIVLNLIGYLVSTGQKGGAAVPTQASRSVGAVSVSFVQQSSSVNLAAFFGSTGYGQRFLMLTQSRAATRAYFV